MVARLDWWAPELAGYLLSRTRWLRQSAVPLDHDDVAHWIKRTELHWAPGCVDPLNDLPWGELDACNTEHELVDAVLMHAAKQTLVQKSSGYAIRRGDAGLVARRRLPLSTLPLDAPGLDLEMGDPETEDVMKTPCADGHVHQGASLPLEVVLHWVAAAVSTIGYRSDARHRPKWLDVDRDEYRPEPLLLLLGLAIREDVPLHSSTLALDAARGDDDAWATLTGLAASVPSAPDADVIPTFDEIVDRKKRLRTDSPDRWLTCLRVEAILHASLTGREPGLDVFVQLFEDLAGTRRSVRSGADKREYFCRAIEHHRALTPQLAGLELRFGELALTGRRRGGVRELEGDFLAALGGYSHYAADPARKPLKVTFPLGLVKTHAASTRNWRFDVRDLYKTIEDLIELLEHEPRLAPFVDGIDVSGLESAAPTWLFTPAFERLARWAQQVPEPLTFRFHAGEWFPHPVNGLRAIDEFLEMTLPEGRRRVGHGLAVESNAWNRVQHASVRELFDDLVWAWSRIARASIREDLQRRLERVVHDLTVPLYGDTGELVLSQDDEMETLWMGYMARTDRQVLEQVGVLSEDAHGRLTFHDGVPSAPRGDVRARLVAETLRVHEGSDAVVGEAFEGEGFEALKDLLLDTYLVLAPLVIERLRGGSIVEACPTSNVVVGGVRGYDNHPLKTLVEKNVDVTINSDDPSLFHTFISEELRHSAPLLGAKLATVVQLGRKVVGARLDLTTVRQEATSLVEAYEARL